MVSTILRYRRKWSNGLIEAADLLDELHKYPRWKQFLKGFVDVYSDQLRIIVTGSSRLEVYRRGGDSLMGRYFSDRMHPFSVAESVTKQLDAPLAFQVVLDEDYVSADCFAKCRGPLVVPARTFLSQLL